VRKDTKDAICVFLLFFICVPALIVLMAVTGL